MKWNKYPETKPSQSNQVEVIFYANKFEWFAGLFTPSGVFGYAEDSFAWHDHQGDDRYHDIEGVKFWIELPSPV